MKLLRRTLDATPQAPSEITTTALEPPDEADVAALLRTEIEAHRSRVATLTANVERQRERLAEAEAAQTDGRRDLARRRARDELDDAGQAEGAAELAAAVQLEQDALRRSEETLDAGLAGFREVVAELEAASLRAVGEQLAAADVRIDELRAQLAQAEAHRDELAEARDELADDLRELRVEADPRLRESVLARRRQEQERIRDLAKKGPRFGRWETHLGGERPMLLLASTTDLIQVVTGQAVTVDVHTDYADYNGTVVTLGRLNTAITTAATTTVVGSPAASTTRNVKTLLARNKHATLSVDVTVRHTDGTTVVELFKTTLLPGELLSFVEGQGFAVYDSLGQVKDDLDANIRTVKLAADQSNSTVTLTEVVGLTTPCQTGVWIFEYFLAAQAAALTTGHRFSVNHTGTVTSFMAWLSWAGGTAASADLPDQDFVAVGGQITSQFAARAKSTLGWGTTTGVDTINADVMYLIQGLVTVTADGNLALWHGSEVAAASTVKGGSALRLTKVG